MASQDEKDFALIEQVEMKFALSETDQQLQGLMSQFLAPLIRKATTSSEPVRAKIVSLLSHILKRLSASPEAKIPALDLVSLLTVSSPIAHILALRFLDQAAKKLSNEEQAQLIVALTQCLNTITTSSSTTSSVLKLIIQMIPQANLIASPKEPTFNVYTSSDLTDLSILCNKLYHFFLHGWVALGEGSPPTTPSLKSLQSNILKYMATPIDDHPKWPFYAYKVFLAGSVSNFRDNVEVAENYLKRVEKPDLENSEIINNLFEMFLENAAPVNLRVKLMDLFIRSQLATTCVSQALKVIFEGLHGTNFNSKLRVRSLLFMQGLIRKQNTSFITQIAPVLLSGLFKILDQGETEDYEHIGVLGATYVTMGVLATQAPTPFQKDITIISRVMNDLQAHQQRIPQIKDALSMMLTAYKNITSWGDDRKQAELLSVLEQNTHSDYPTSRLYAFRYLVDVFPEYHLHSRFLCILGSGDHDSSIREIATEGIKHNYEPDSKQLNPFELVKYVHHSVVEVARPLPDHLQPKGGESMIMGLSPTILLNFLLYVWSLLVQSPIDELVSKSISDPEKDSISRLRLSKLLLDEITSSDSMSDEIDQPSVSLSYLLSYIRESLVMMAHPGPLQLTSANFLCQIICCAPDWLIGYLAKDLNWFKSLLQSGTVEIRSLMTRSYAIVLVGSTPLDSEDPLHALTSLLNESNTLLTTDKAAESKQQVALITIGYLVGRIAYRFPHLQSPLLVQSIQTVLDRCKPTTTSSILHSSLLALRECGRYRPLPQEVSETVFELLKKIIFTTSDTKVAEAALLTLGHLGVGNPQLTQPTLQIFFDIPYPLNKNVEVYFRAGEAIACLAGRWNCPLMATYLDLPPHTPPNQELAEVEILEKVVTQLKAAARADSPNKRKGAAFCLLSIVKYCHKDPELARHFADLHATFISLLTNPDELVQEVASTGMSIIYDHTQEEEKGALVSSLMAIFNNGQSLSQTMAGAESDLFSSGSQNQSLGRAPDGSQLNTYSSIMSLAADMNQPELIYPFLQLARSNAVWASRQGAAFGLTRLLGPAREHIAPYLAGFLPRLYRYRYDPDPRVAQTMDSIWGGLVSNQSDDIGHLLDKHFDGIATDLLKGMGDRSWRTRQSSASALADLLHGRRDVDLAKYMDQVWLMSFRAMDDIKETVREAGLKASRSSLNITLKYVDPDNHTPRQGADILQAVLPFLIEKGLFSDAEEVRTFSLNAILKVISKSGSLLKPHLVPLIKNILDAMTAMESDSVNYLSFHVDKYNLTQEELDGYRLADLKKSPLSLAIGTCIPFIDAPTLEVLIPELNTKIRRSVGFATKAGCARVVAGLISEKADLLQPYSATLLKAMMVALGDSSVAIRKLWAATIGAITPIVETTPLFNFLKGICEEYMSSEDEKRRLICATACLEVSRKASGSFMQARNSILPFAYFGQYDSSPETARIWSEVWRDATTGTTATLLEHLNSIMGLIISQFDTTSWATKQQAAKSLGTAATLLENKLSPEWIDRSVDTLLQHLSGRIWDGKENLLTSLSQVVVAGKDYIRTNDKYPTAISQALLRDIKKKSLVFKTRAVEVITQIMPVLGIHHYSEIASTLLPLLSNSATCQDDDVIDTHLKPRMLVLKSHIIRCLFATLPPLTELTPDELTHLNEALTNLQYEAWNIRLAALESLEKLTQLLTDSPPSPSTLTSIWPGTIGLLHASLEDQKYIQVRQVAVLRLTELTHLSIVIDTPSLHPLLRDTLTLGRRDPSPQISEPLQALSLPDTNPQ